MLNDVFRSQDREIIDPPTVDNGTRRIHQECLGHVVWLKQISQFARHIEKDRKRKILNSSTNLAAARRVRLESDRMP